MPVLCEAFSVIVRRDSIDRVLKNGWEEFLATVPNETLCTDGDLARVGFMDPDAVKKYIKTLEYLGLKFLSDETNVDETKESIDIAVVDQFSGPTTKCDWIEYGELPIDKTGKKIACCWLFEGRRIGGGLHFRQDMNLQIVTPSWWEPNKMLKLVE